MPKVFASDEERRLYNRRHYRVNRARGKASEHPCVTCEGAASNWAHIHGTTGDDPQDYQAMCYRCHLAYDDRWNEEERAKVAESTRQVWANSPERRLAMSVYPHRLRR